MFNSGLRKAPLSILLGKTKTVQGSIKTPQGSAQPILAQMRQNISSGVGDWQCIFPITIPKNEETNSVAHLILWLKMRSLRLCTQHSRSPPILFLALVCPPLPQRHAPRHGDGAPAGTQLRYAT